MPAKKTKGSVSGRAKKRVPPTARKVRGGFKCPDCGFVAKHAMGLGRHRSARHGVVSKRQQRSAGAGRWVTRQQAAERADVHYNTVRQWEKSGLLRRSKRPGVRGALVSADDLERLLGEREALTAGFDSLDSNDAAVKALTRRYDRLIADLEQLLTTARETRAGTGKRGPGRPPGKKKAATARKTATKKGRSSRSSKATRTRRKVS